VRKASPLKSALGRVFRVSTDETAWRVGAAGQRKVGLALSRLGQSWRTLHAIPLGENHTDIDHLVIGPPGIFTLSTKYHRGAVVQVFGDAVRVDGGQEPYVSQARHEAWRAACLLTAACGYRVVVAPAVVVVGAEDVRVARPAEGVQILDRRHLLRWLTALPPRLKPPHVTQIYEAARRSDTWLRRSPSG
jgi:nuclease-like protein